MAELEKKYLGSEGLQRLWEKIERLFVRKDGNKVLSDNNFSDAEKAKLEGIEIGANKYILPIASGEVLGGVKIGKGIIIDEHGFISTTVNPDVTMRWSQIINTPTTLAGYGIIDAATKAEFDALVAKLSAAFKYAGSVATYADLLAVENPDIGDVYNVEENGKNYAWNNISKCK